MNAIHGSRNYESVISLAHKQKAAKQAGLSNLPNVSQVSGQTSFLTDTAQVKSKTTTSLDRDFIDTTNSLTQTISQTKNKFLQDDITMAYGYSVDSLGFMGADFNRDANLPQDFKIHKSTLDELKDFNERSFYHLPKNSRKGIFENIDMADTIKQYYRIFDKITGGITKNKELFNNQDLQKLPTGYTTHSINGRTPIDNGTFLPKLYDIEVTNVYKNQDEFQRAEALSDKLSRNGITSFYPKKVTFSEKYFDTNRGGLFFTPDMSVYKQGDSYNKSGVFVGFLKNGAKFSDSGHTQLKANILAQTIPLAKESSFSNSLNLKKIQQDENAFIDMIKLHLARTNQSPISDTKARNIAQDLISELSEFTKQTRI